MLPRLAILRRLAMLPLLPILRSEDTDLDGPREFLRLDRSMERPRRLAMLPLLPILRSEDIDLEGASEFLRLELSIERPRLLPLDLDLDLDLDRRPGDLLRPLLLLFCCFCS